MKILASFAAFFALTVFLTICFCWVLEIREPPGVAIAAGSVAALLAAATAAYLKVVIGTANRESMPQDSPKRHGGESD